MDEKELLKELREKLVNESKKWQEMEQDLEEKDLNEGRGKTKKLGSHPGTGGLDFEDKEKGILNIFMLCIITLVMMVLFTSISYLIFK